MDKTINHSLLNKSFIRFYDFLIAAIILFFLSPLMIFTLMICFLESRNPIFVQVRVGKNKKAFKLIKFRTMKSDTPSLASHLVNKRSLTKFGGILRSLKIDELPQLINVLNGEMSLVGPRPCLFNQFELIKLRENYNVFSVKPGITGLSQIKGIDMSNPLKLAKTDFKMISTIKQIHYFKYLFLTFYGKGIGDKIKNN